jgi:polyhydroxybutyrate depolymerase
MTRIEPLNDPRRRADGRGHRWRGSLSLAVFATLAVLLPPVTAFALALRPSAHAVGMCGNAPAAGSTQLDLVVGGVPRSALVHVPSGIRAGRRVSLVLALHGLGSTGPQMERYSGFSHQADLHGFVVAYPSARNFEWNLSRDRRRADDVAFAAALIDRLQKTLCLDGSRTFATGVSNGAGMVAVLGCTLSTEIEAIAPVAGDYDGVPACRAKRPESVLEIHGTDDVDAPYLGSKGRASGHETLPPFVKAWVQRDRCKALTQTRRMAPRTTLYVWGGCAAGSLVQHVQITGGVHQWPGAVPPDPGPPTTICAACTIWGFFANVGAGRTRAVGQTGSPASGGAGV